MMERQVTLKDVRGYVML